MIKVIDSKAFKSQGQSLGDAWILWLFHVQPPDLQLFFALESVCWVKANLEFGKGGCIVLLPPLLQFLQLSGCFQQVQSCCLAFLHWTQAEHGWRTDGTEIQVWVLWRAFVHPKQCDSDLKMEPAGVHHPA